MIEAQRLAPSSWTGRYLGLPYVLGTGECAHRAALVWREEFGIEVEVAPAHGDMAVAEARVREHLETGDWLPARRPAEGDAVIMWKGERVCHVGVFVAPNHVLHCTRARGMTLDPIEDLPHHGFRLYGCFRHRPAMALAA